MAIAILTALAAVSCNKDEEESTTMKYIQGRVQFEAPDFIGKNTTLSMTPSGARHPAGGNIGYYFKVSDLMETNDTTKRPSESGDGTFTFNFGDSLGTYTVECDAYTDDGYYSISNTRVVTIVEEGVSLKHEHLETDGWYTDPRDNAKYSVSSFNGYDWIKPNLQYKGTDGKLGLPFKKCEIMNSIFGRFYTWEEAQKACPEGWELPTDEEWAKASQGLTSTKLEAYKDWPGIAGDYLTYAEFNYYDLLEFWPKVKVTNKTGLSFMPFGFASNDSYFDGSLSFATFWTASTDPANSANGIYRYFTEDQADIFVGTAAKNMFRANVRCLRKSADQ